MDLYKSVVKTVNKVFTKEFGRHWFIHNTFDEIFLNGKYGDGTKYVNNQYRRHCMIRVLYNCPELDGVTSITKEEAKKYVPMIVEEIERFRNGYIEEYFGTAENMEKHYKKLQEEAEASLENLETTFTEIPLFS